MSRCVTSTNESVRSSIDSIPARRLGSGAPDGSSWARSSTASRCFTIAPSRRSPQLDAVVAAVDLGEADPYVFDERGRQVLADVVGADRQLAVAAVDEHRELHGPGPAELEQRVERGAARCGR